MSNYRWVQGVVADIQITSDTYSIMDTVTTDHYKTLYIVDSNNVEHCVVVSGDFAVRNGHKIILVISNDKYVSILNSTLGNCTVFSNVSLLQFICWIFVVLAGVFFQINWKKDPYFYTQYNVTDPINLASLTMILIGVCGLAYWIYILINNGRVKQYTKKLSYS